MSSGRRIGFGFELRQVTVTVTVTITVTGIYRCSDFCRATKIAVWSKFINEISTSISVQRELGAGFRLPHKKSKRNQKQRHKNAKWRRLTIASSVSSTAAEASSSVAAHSIYWEVHKWKLNEKKKTKYKRKRKIIIKIKIINKRWQSVLASCIIFVIFVGRIQQKFKLEIEM